MNDGETNAAWSVHTVCADPATAVVAVRGELDSHTAATLEWALAETLTVCASPRDRTTTAIVADLTAVDFLDSSGLNVLLQAKRRLAELGVGFSVRVREDSAAEKLLALVGLTAELTAPEPTSPRNRT